MKNALKRTALYAWYRALKDRFAVLTWKIRGRKTRPPHGHKVDFLKKTAQLFSLQTFVETGTYLGDTIYKLRNTFDKLYSIELDPTLATNAKKRVSEFPNITIFEGDSETKLAPIVNRLSAPSLFWLDAHYSGHITAKGRIETPIETELSIVAASPYAHVIVIDDARCFDGTHDYPKIDKLRSITKTLFPSYNFNIADDMIILSPPTET